jgi:drug/metabolite transporter (DMT)-like permease
MNIDAKIVRSQQQFGLILLLTGALADSLGGLFTRLIAADAWTMIFWRGVFAGLFVLLYLAVRQRRRFLNGFFTIGAAGVLLILLNAAGMVASLQSLRLTPVANFFMIFATAPFVAALLARFAIKERLDPPTILASTLGFIGVAIMMVSSAGSGHLAGDLLACLVVLIYAALVITIRRRNVTNIEPVICLTVFASALLAFPFAAPLSPAAGDFGLLALFGCIQLGLGNILIFNSARMIPAAQSGLLGVLNCALAPFWVWLILGEAPPSATMVGGALIMAGTIAHLVWNFSRRSRLVQAAVGA